MDIRRYTAQDAEALSALFRRNHYGPTRLDGRTVHEVLRERVPLLCLVAVSGGTVHGCVAVCSSSGRRSAEEDEAFVGALVIDQGLRSSSLAGRLFGALFSQVVMNTGVRRLRVEVDPSNRRALPLYLRVGFRALPGARADEDGYVELVSDLSSLVRDLCSGRLGPTGSIDLPALRWKPVASGRGVGMSEGVWTVDGRDVVTHTITTDDLTLRATMDFTTGDLIDVETLKGRLLTVPPAAPRTTEPGPAGSVLETSVGELVLRVDTDGHLTLSHGRGEHEQVVIREMWPVEVGHQAPGQRRQPTRYVHATPTGPSSWRLQCAGTGVSRDVSVRDGTLTLTATPPAGHEVLTSPWIAARRTELGLRGAGDQSGQWQAGPLLQGLWPGSWTDFEAACPTTAEAACIDDGQVRLLLTWVGRARVEARTVAALRSQAPGEPVTMTVSPLDVMPESSCPAGLTPVPIPGGTSCGTRQVELEPVEADLESVESGRSETATLQGLGHRLEVVPSVGIVEWSLHGEVVMTGSYPGHSVLGALAERRVGLWCTGLADRHDPDQGLEWAPDTEALSLEAPALVPLRHGEGEVRGTWQVRALENSLVVSAATTQWPEAAVNLVPLTAKHSSVLVTLRGRCYALEPGGCWRGAVDGVGVPLVDGGLLLVTGAGPCREVGGEASEVFVRQLGENLMVTVLAPGSVRARLRVVRSRPEAVAALAGGNTTG